MFIIIEKDLTKESTIRTSSYTKYYALVNNTDDINYCLEFLKRNKLKVKILGNGSNILFLKEQEHKNLKLINL